MDVYMDDLYFWCFFFSSFFFWHTIHMVFFFFFCIVLYTHLIHHTHIYRRVFFGLVWLAGVDLVFWPWVTSGPWLVGWFVWFVLGGGLADWWAIGWMAGKRRGKEVVVGAQQTAFFLYLIAATSLLLLHYYTR